MRTAPGVCRIAFLLVALCAAAQQPTAVDITSEPSHHKVFENKYLRAFDVKVAPKASTLVHRHDYDYIFVTLGDADITNAKVGAAPVQAKLKDGDTRYAAGKFAHAAINNLSDRDFRNITIELLNPTTGEANCTEGCKVEVPCKSEDKANCPTIQRGIYSDQWAVFTLTLPPGATYEHQASGHARFNVAVTDFDVKVKTPDGHEGVVHQNVGSVAWHEDMSHSITNVGSKPVVVVSIEMKDTAANKSTTGNGMQH